MLCFLLIGGRICLFVRWQQKTRGFYMCCIREKIQRSDGLGMIAGVDEKLQVARQGRGVTGNVDDSFRRNPAQGVDNRRSAAAARRVDYGGVKMMGLCKLRQQRFGFAAIKVDFIQKPIVPGVIFCVFNRRRDAFNAQHAPGALRGQKKRNRPSAAISVQNGLALRRKKR